MAPPSTTTTLPGGAGCPAGATFVSLECRLDALGATVLDTSDLGEMRDRLGRQVGRAQTSLERATERCGASRRGAARRNLQAMKTRLGALRRKLGSQKLRHLIPPGVATRLVDATGTLVVDTKALASALVCP